MKETQFVLALYPTIRGYAFVLFEGPESPFDWGTKDIRTTPKNAVVLEDVGKLIERYHPVVLILEDVRKGPRRRSLRIKRLFRSLVHLANASDVCLRIYSREAVRTCFTAVGAKTKYEIAQAIAQRIPAFKHRLPPVRKIWMSEDTRQSLFDAAALGVTYYSAEENSDVDL